MQRGFILYKACVQRYIKVVADVLLQIWNVKWKQITLKRIFESFFNNLYKHNPKLDK